MAWLVYTNQQMGYEDEPTDLLLVLEASGPRDARARSSMWGCPILAAWAIEHPAMRLW